MNDLTDLPLFAGIPAEELPPPKRRRPPKRNLVAELFPACVDHARLTALDGRAIVLPFPASRNVLLVAELAEAFVTLRERYGSRCRAMLLDRHFRPIGLRLRRMGVPPAEIATELARLEKAVAKIMWLREGKPSHSSGGGSAA